MALSELDLDYMNSDRPEDLRLSSDQQKRLAKKTKDMLWDEFKIEIGEDGRVPKDENGVSRILIYGKDKDGKMGLQDPNELGILPGSTEFVQQAEKGNVFVYGAGKDKPVQLQAWTNDPKSFDQATFSKTKEVDADELPAPPRMRMGRLRSFLRRITGGLLYRDRYREVERQKAEIAAMKEKMKSVQEKRGKTGASELKNVEKLTADRIRRGEDAKRRKELATAQGNVDKKQLGLENHVSVFRPDPVIVPRIETTYTAQGKVENVGFYKRDEFKDLTVFTKDAKRLQAEQEKKMSEMDPQQRQAYKPYKYVEFDKDIPIGNKGAKLTDKEFAAVAICTCWRPDRAAEEYKTATNYDPTLKQSLKNAGFPEKDLDLIISVTGRSMATTDNFMKKGRENAGPKFGSYLDPARKETVEAFNAYKQGNKEPLAALLANGVNRVVDSLQTTGSQVSLDNDVYACAEVGRSLLTLMEKDPQLQQLALQKGMEPERLQAMKGLVKMDELDNEALRATRDLTKAVADRREPTKAEKKDLAVKILTSRLALLKLQEHQNNVENDPQSKTKQMLDKVSYTQMSERKKLPPEEWKPSTNGVLDIENLSMVNYGIKAAYAPMPQITKSLTNPAEVQKLKQLAETIVDQQKLADLSAEELNKELSPSTRTHKFNLTNALVQAMEAPQKAQPAQQPVQAEKNLQNRQQPVQTGGPQLGAPQ